MKDFKIQIILLVIQTLCFITFLFTQEFKTVWIQNVFNFLVGLFILYNILEIVILLRYKK